MCQAVRKWSSGQCVKLEGSGAAVSVSDFEEMDQRSLCQAVRKWTNGQCNGQYGFRPIVSVEDR